MEQKYCAQSEKELPSRARYPRRRTTAGVVGLLKISLMDISGREVTSELFDKREHTFTTDLNVRGICAGILFVKVSINGRHHYRKIIVQ